MIGRISDSLLSNSRGEYLWQTNALMLFALANNAMNKFPLTNKTLNQSIFFIQKAARFGALGAVAAQLLNKILVKFNQNAQ